MGPFPSGGPEPRPCASGVLGAVLGGRPQALQDRWAGRAGPGTGVPPDAKAVPEAAPPGQLPAPLRHTVWAQGPRKGRDPMAGSGLSDQDHAAAVGFPDLCDRHQELTAKPETINTDKREVTIMVSVQLVCRRRGEDWMVNNEQTP